MKIFILFSLLFLTIKSQIYLNDKVFEEQERISELYYERQKGERRKHMEGDYLHINANYPCFQGVNALGLSDSYSVHFGHKYACGIHKITDNPVVYSLGSNKKQDFEISFLHLRPDSKIFVYEINAEKLPPNRLRRIQIAYHAIGLGYEKSNSSVQLMTLHDMMTANNHSYIDVLKMDIEGFEWLFMKYEAPLLARIGQVLVEVHAYTKRFQHLASPRGPVELIEAFEKNNFRLFHKEGNFNPGYACCSEWSVIQRDWNGWDKFRKMALPALSKKKATEEGG